MRRKAERLAGRRLYRMALKLLATRPVTFAGDSKALVEAMRRAEREVRAGMPLRFEPQPPR